MRRTKLLSLMLTTFSFIGGMYAAEDLPGLVQKRFVEQGKLTDPTGISVSPEGVAYVSCDLNGTTNRLRKAGKVVRCEDTNGDGVADKFTDFVKGINSPRGSCFVDDTLYLLVSPHLAAYEDKNGDGVADKVTLLVTNLGQPVEAMPITHGPNGLRMGIDGWLYLAIGDQGCYQAKGMDGSQVTMQGGGVLRVRPDGSQLSIVASGTRNIYDIAVDPYLNLFARDNTNDGGGWGTRLHQLTELADFGYPRLFHNFSNEAMSSLVDFGLGAGTGMYYLHEPGYPEDFGDALYSGDLNTGVAILRRKAVGESFQIQQASFQDLPKNIGIDVDGSSQMYFASRQGGTFGVASRPFGHVDVVQPEDTSNSAKFPNINKAKDSDLVTYLASPSQVTRINAMREMVTRGSKSTFTKGLLATAKNPEAALYARVAALMTLKQLEGNKSHKAIADLYNDKELREFVVRALGDAAKEFDSTSQKICLQALKDENPRVQMRAIIGLSRSGDPKVASSILPLAKGEKLIVNDEPSEEVEQDKEGWSIPHQAISHTALKAVIQLNAVEALLSKLDDKDLREAALRGLQEIHSDKVISGLAKKLAGTKDKELAKLIALALFRLYHQEAPWNGKTWWKGRPNFKGPYYQPAIWAHTPAVSAAITLAFNKVDPADFAFLFQQMRKNQVPEEDLTLEIHFDEALSLLSKKELTSTEFNFVMAAAIDEKRPTDQQTKIYNYFKNGPLPDSYFNRAHILRAWGEGRTDNPIHRKAYEEFVSGKEFIGRVQELDPFFKSSEKDAYKYAHLQILNLINNPSAPKETRAAAEAEMEKTWADAKNIYRPYRLRGLMLAFEEADPSPYAKQLKPLVEHRDERTKQGAARYLEAIGK